MALNDAGARTSGAKTAHSSPVLDRERRKRSARGAWVERRKRKRSTLFAAGLSAYETVGQPEYRDPHAEALAEFLNEVHDDAFDEALLELVHEDATLVEDRFAAETGDLPAQGRQIESLLSVHFAPLAAEISRALDTLQEQLRGRDPRTMTNEEIDALTEAYAPAQAIPPEFENFVGKLVKKAGKGAWLKVGPVSSYFLMRFKKGGCEKTHRQIFESSAVNR